MFRPSTVSWPHSVHHRDHCLNYKYQLWQHIYICAHIFVHKVFVIYVQFTANQNKFKHFCRNPNACSMQIKEGRKGGWRDGQTIRYDEGYSHFLHLVNATKNSIWYNICILSKWPLMLSILWWRIFTEIEGKVMCELMQYD